MRRDRPLASVVINNYNYARYLGEAIDSALAQTYQPLEVVVVDDGSTDDSRAVIASYGERVVLVLKENGGQGSALNAGFAASRGEVVIFLDSDDVLLPTALEQAVPLLCESGVAKVHWPLWETDARGARTGRLVPTEPLPGGDLREFTLQVGPASSVSPPMSGNAWARSLLEHVMPIPELEERIIADAFLIGLAPAFGCIWRVEEPQALYRVHGGNDHTRLRLEGRIDAGLRTNELEWRVLEEHCRRASIPVNSSNWERESYFHQLRRATEEIRTVILAGETFILVDEGKWAADATVAGRPWIPFLECDGWYCGPPADDAMAIRELERLRAERSPTHLAVAWPAFWWLEYYDGFAAHLRSAFPCVLQNERLVVFDLRPEVLGALSLAANGA